MALADVIIPTSPMTSISLSFYLRSSKIADETYPTESEKLHKNPHIDIFVLPLVHYFDKKSNSIINILFEIIERLHSIYVANQSP